MNKHFLIQLLGLLLFIILTTAAVSKIDWGFYGHKRINRMAVFTLPKEMIGFYKQNIEYITEHAVDPDKRRYATKHEGVRHYIDIDHWGDEPFEIVPENLNEAIIQYCDFILFTDQGDTLQLLGNALNHSNLTLIDSTKNLYKDVKGVEKTFSYTAYADFQEDKMIVKAHAPQIFARDTVHIPRQDLHRFAREHIMKLYYEDEWIIDGEIVNQFLAPYQPKVNVVKAQIKDNFSKFGILPYHLSSYIQRLTKAFESKDEGNILRLSAEIGHYIGDAHVPLHTTENYNGQFTNQDGIHGFWESRIPELFADDHYDFWVGKAAYVDQPKDFFWQIIKDSHAHLDSVLIIERELSKTFAHDQQYCYETRNNATIRTQCKAYATAFHERMNGMVEERMTKSVHAIGSVWFTAWVNAGQPQLKKMGEYSLSEQENKELEKEEKLFKGKNILGRKHSE